MANVNDLLKDYGSGIFLVSVRAPRQFALNGASRFFNHTVLRFCEMSSLTILIPSIFKRFGRLILCMDGNRFEFPHRVLLSGIAYYCFDVRAARACFSGVNGSKAMSQHVKRCFKDGRIVHGLVGMVSARGSTILRRTWVGAWVRLYKDLPFGDLIERNQEGNHDALVMANNGNVRSWYVMVTSKIIANLPVATAPLRVACGASVLRGELVARGPSSERSKRRSPLITFNGAKETILARDDDRRVSFRVVVIRSTRVASVRVFLLNQHYVKVGEASIRYQCLIKTISNDNDVRVLMRVLLVKVSCRHASTIFVNGHSYVTNMRFRFLPLLVHRINDHLPHSVRQINARRYVSVTILHGREDNTRDVPSFRGFPVGETSWPRAINALVIVVGVQMRTQVQEQEI